MSILIKHGRIVTAAEDFIADVYIDGVAGIRQHGTSD